MDNPFAIKDIAPPIESLQTGRPTLWIWLALALIIAGFVIYRKMHKITAPPQPVPLPPPTVTALQEALRRIDKLIAEKLIESGATKEFFTKLNHILRTFLQDEYISAASALTTSELLHNKSFQTEISDNCRPKLDAFLKQCDLFKFADIKAQPQIAINACKVCRDLIVSIAAERGEAEI
jgi:hypothetical protein